jgi:hypothetical protein
MIFRVPFWLALSGIGALRVVREGVRRLFYPEPLAWLNPNSNFAETKLYHYRLLVAACPHIRTVRQLRGVERWQLND